MPLSRTKSTRLIFATGHSEQLAACQTNASAAVKSGLAGAGGAMRSNAATIRATLAANSAGRAGESGAMRPGLLPGEGSAGKGQESAFRRRRILLLSRARWL